MTTLDLGCLHHMGRDRRPWIWSTLPARVWGSLYLLLLVPLSVSSITTLTEDKMDRKARKFVAQTKSATLRLTQSPRPG